MTAALTPTNTSDRALRDQPQAVQDVAAYISRLHVEIENQKASIELHGNDLLEAERKTEAFLVENTKLRAAHDALASEFGRTCGELMTARVALAMIPAQVVEDLKTLAAHRAGGPDEPWPSGCLKPNSCSRHFTCMYARSKDQCRHYGHDLKADVEAALLTQQEASDA